MIFPRYIPYKGRFIRVVGCFEDFQENDLEVGKGYVFDDAIAYVYVKNEKSEDAQLPHFTLKDGVAFLSDPNSIKDHFELTRSIKMPSTEDVVSNIDLETEKLYADELQSQISKASSVYNPIFYEQDDFLKRTIKCALLEKQIDMNVLKMKAPMPHVFSNLLNALENETKMSVLTFEHWINDLDLNYHVIVSDRDSRVPSPINGAIIYSSDKNELGKISKEDFEKMLKEIEEVVQKYTSIEFVSRDK